MNKIADVKTQETAWELIAALREKCPYIRPGYSCGSAAGAMRSTRERRSIRSIRPLRVRSWQNSGRGRVPQNNSFKKPAKS